MRRWPRRLLCGSAWAYLVGVVGYALALRLLGERWWLTTIGLYLPHALALTPGVPLVLLLAVAGPRRLLPIPLIAMILVLVWVMGLVVNCVTEAPSGAPHLRVLSYNVDSGRRGIDELSAQILEAKPDIVLLQETDRSVSDRITRGLSGFVGQANGQFYIASRWPVASTLEPPLLVVRDVGRTPRFVRYTVTAPFGSIELFNVHPISPRDGFERIRGTGLIDELGSGGFLFNDRGALTDDTELRRVQATAIAELAGAATRPVIIAGDTNLPEHSTIFAETLGRFQDGFSAVGWGFGYTYPAHTRFAWTRIDRILAGPGLRFLTFQVGTRRGSDHRCVWADLELRP